MIFAIAASGGALQASSAGAALAVFPALATQPYGATAQVVEIVGERGTPQPVEWMIRLKDPTARAGVREITLVNGRITSERTPVHSADGVASLLPISRADVAIDSDEVFRIVNREAVKNELGFHWIEYVLRTDAAAGSPVWDVRVFDNMGAQMGTLKISAKSGAVVRGFVPVSNLETTSPAKKGR